MDLFTCDKTLREIAGKESQFPSTLRHLICHALQQIQIEEMSQLLTKHETDPDNFDGKFEAFLRKSALTDMSIDINQHISKLTRFNSDIIIHFDNIYTCIEIEKGYLARFELDILKMQSFASMVLKKDVRQQIFGVFIVPADNVVANHISGNKNESSFKYLTRLSRLVSQLRPFLVRDILFVGYSLSEIKTINKYAKSSSKSEINRVSNVNVIKGNPLVEVNEIKQKFQGYQLELVMQLRSVLTNKFPELNEKLNFKSRYLGYSNGQTSDSVYVWIQKKKLLLDIRVSKEESDVLKRHGFEVNPRNNYQCRSGWLTGVSVPHDTDKLDAIVELVSLALKA